MNTSKELIKKTINNLVNNSEQWNFEENTAYNSTTGITIWIGNGWESMSFYKPFQLNINLWNRFKLKRAIEQCKINLLTKYFDERIQE